MKKFRNIIIFSILFIFLVTCSISILIAAKPITFDELIKESDCCVRVCRREAFDENGVAFSNYVDGKYHIEIWVNPICERDRELFPEKITIIQDEPILDAPTKNGFNVNAFVFLTKTNQNNIYILTGNKSGVIRTNYQKLEPMDKELSDDIRKNFKNNYKNFVYWLENEYEFSSAMYETAESSNTETISENAINTSPNNS